MTLKQHHFFRHRYFLPRIWEEISDSTEFYGWNFLKPLIGKQVFWASVDWHTQNKDLPADYPYYLIKTEGPNIDWIERQADLVDGLIFVCCLPNDYNYFQSHDRVIFLPCVEWHYQLDAMMAKFDVGVSKSIDKKVSVLTNRITYSKLVAVSAVLTNINLQDVCYSLHNRIEDKNVHSWQDTANKTVNYYKNNFLKNFKTYQNTIDTAFSSNNLDLLHDYHHPAYQTAAINVTNESWNYSQREKLLPGPFITEKTLKCLLGETAFLANGQFDTYQTLKKFGFEFDYGLDLSFDNAVGDLDRLEQLTTTIKSLSDIETYDLYQQTRKSCLHNKNWIVSGEFYRIAEQFNTSSIEKMINLIDNE